MLSFADDVKTLIASMTFHSVKENLMGYGSWGVACVPPETELEFQEKVKKLNIPGVDCYVPIRKIIKPVTRRRRKIEVVPRPLFFRYVFIKLPDFYEHRSILGMTNMKYYLLRGMENEYETVRDTEVRRIQDLESQGEFDDVLPETVKIKFHAGSVHLVMSGPFEDREAKIITTPKTTESPVLCEVNGRVVRMPLYYLRKKV